MSKAALEKMDARISAGLGHVGLVDTATIKGEEVDGYYMEEPVEDGEGEDQVVTMLRTFDCRAAAIAALPALAEGDPIVVAGYGTFRYLRSMAHGNDRVLLELGKVINGS